MMQGMNVRPVGDGGAIEVLLRLWAANLNAAVSADLRAQHRWYYEENPAGPGQALLLEKGGEAIGCAGIGPRRFCASGTPLRGALLGDFAVDRQHRTALPALVLQRAVMRQVQSGYDFAYGFPNAAAVGVLRRVGFQQIGALQRYVRLLRHGGYLARVLPHPSLGRAAAWVPDGLLALRDSLRARRHDPGLVLVRLGRQGVDQRFDRLFEEHHRHHPLLGQRGAAFLRWRFFDRPGEPHEIAALIDRGGRDGPARGVLLAYAVLHIAGNRAHLRDLFGGDLEVLLDRLAPALRRRGVEAMSMRFLGARSVVRALLTCGFRPRGAERAVVIRPGPASLSGASGLPALNDPEGWYLTDADEDN